MFYTILNYIRSQSIILPIHVDTNVGKNEIKNDKIYIWSKNCSTFLAYSYVNEQKVTVTPKEKSSNIIYTDIDIESGLIKYDFYDVMIRSM